MVKIASVVVLSLALIGCGTTQHVSTAPLTQQAGIEHMKSMGRAYHVDLRISYFDQEAETRMHKEASAVVFKYNGTNHLLSSAHILPENATAVEVELSHNAIVLHGGKAVCVRHSDELDLMLLDIGGALEGFPSAPLAAKTPLVGSTVYANGSPARYRTWTTRGIISQQYNRMVAFDAPTREGCSGGGLYHNGQLIGIVSARTDHFCGMAIKVEKIKEFLNTDQ